jgi:hypothetical protein
MNRFRAILVAWAALSAGPAFGGSPDPKDLSVPPEELSRARELVRRMGSELYREREEAQAELAKMGRLAKQVLAEAAVTDTDPEIRLRASRLLPKAKAADLQARIDTFLADTESKFDHDLPGLKTFRKQLNTAEREKVRALYVEILKSPYNIELFAAMDRSETEGGRALADRRNALWNDMQQRPFPQNGKANQLRQPTLADVAALLFAESVVSSDHVPKANAWNGVTGILFIQQGPGPQALVGSGVAHADAFKTIVRQWLATRTDVNELSNIAYQLNQTALKQFPEALALARRIVTTEGVQGYARGHALSTVMQHALAQPQKGKDEIPFLKTLTRDDTMVQQIWFGRPGVGGQPEMHSCLMKDVALAYLITQAGGNMKDYGFETAPGAVPIGGGQLPFGQYAFTSEEKRNAAFMKWGWKQLKEKIDAPVKAAPDAKEPAPEPTKDAPKDGPAIKPGVRPLPAPVPGGPAPAVPAVPPPAPNK